MDNLLHASKEDATASKEESRQIVTLKMILSAMVQISINAENLPRARTVNVFAMIQLLCTPSVNRCQHQNAVMTKNARKVGYVNMVSANARSIILAILTQTVWRDQNAFMTKNARKVGCANMVSVNARII